MNNNTQNNISSASATPLERVAELILAATRTGIFKRAVLSKSTDKAVARATVTPKAIKGGICLQIERMCYADTAEMVDKNRSVPLLAKHENIPLDGDISIDAKEKILNAISGFMQINILSVKSGCDCEYKRAKSGKETLIGESKLRAALNDALADASEKDSPARLPLLGNDREKKRILSGNEEFLKLLGISDANGRVHDKKQPKFRQINRFLEIVRDTEKHLPADTDYELHICDLCCGKSYLSFAVYYYFTEICHRRVVMRGVDMKADVMEECNRIAKKLNMDGLSFVCRDITLYDFGENEDGSRPSEIKPYVDMVVSLHACDTATDMVLSKACEWEARVILSTPCCHHELNRLLDCPELAFISEHSMLRQKLCDAATDALRLKLLEAHGYDVASLELIDPEETPKNILLRGIRKYSPDSQRAKNALREYEEARKFLIRK